MARRLGDWDLRNDSYLNLAYLYCISGLYFEAHNALVHEIDSAPAESQTNLENYYLAQRKLNDELSLYSLDDEIRHIASRRRDFYRRKLLETMEQGSDIRLEFEAASAIQQQDYNRAEKIALMRLRNHTPSDHDYAKAAYQLALIAQLQGNTEKMMIWQARSACTDIELAVRDNFISLNELAHNLLIHYGDAERSMRYMRIVMDDTRFFNSVAAVAGCECPGRHRTGLQPPQSRLERLQPDRDGLGHRHRDHSFGGWSSISPASGTG